MLFSNAKHHTVTNIIQQGISLLLCLDIMAGPDFSVTILRLYKRQSALICNFCAAGFILVDELKWVLSL